MREPPDAVQMIAQGNNRRFFHQFPLAFTDLSQSHTGKQAIAQATPFLRIELQAAFIDKAIYRSGRAALEKTAVPIRVRFAKSALLQKANITDTRPGSINRFVCKGVI